MPLEVVTLRGSTLVLAAALLVVLPGFAGATGPLPKREWTVAPADMSVGVVREEVFEKSGTIPEHCTPRPLVLCAGPYDPDVDIHFGRTGFRVLTNDTNATLGHDPARHWEYGPYYSYAWLDDARLCESGCKVPNSMYGSAYGNVTVIVYVAGKEKAVPVALDQRDIGLDRPPILQPSCRLTAWYTCISLS